MAVIVIIGIREVRSALPMINKFGSSIQKETSKPLPIPFIFNWIKPIKSPMITHMLNADKFADHGNFCRIIGTTSIIPAAIPNNSPV